MALTDARLYSLARSRPHTYSVLVSIRIGLFQYLSDCGWTEAIKLYWTFWIWRSALPSCLGFAGPIGTQAITSTRGTHKAVHSMRDWSCSHGLGLSSNKPTCSSLAAYTPPCGSR